MQTFDITTILVVVFFLFCMVVAGFYSSSHNKTTEDYFVGNRSFAGWTIGISMLGTIVSSMTFLALPAAAYILDWRQLTINLVVPFIAILAVIVFIPFFRRGKLTSAFEYLGERYGIVPRRYGAISYILLEIIRMAQILFLLAIVIEFLTGVSIVWAIIVTSLVTGFYTVVGGFKAVVWTDVIQAIILLIGALICVVWISFGVPGGFTTIVEVGQEYNKFSLGAMDFDLAERTFYTVAILGIINWLGIFGGDQNMVQRYISARSTREARKATIIYVAIAVPLWTLFFFVGTSLFVYFIFNSDPIISGLEADQVFPYFILSRLHPFVSGVIISAAFAAAMSSLSSGINGISTVSIIDLMKSWIVKDREDSYYLKAAHWIAGTVTVLVVFGAIFFSQLEKESMNNISLIVASVFGGCIMGLFMIGFFTKRIDGFSATIALLVSILFNIYLGLGLLKVLPETWILPIHSYWVGALVNGAFIVTAYIIGVFRHKPDRNLDGLTVWTLK